MIMFGKLPESFRQARHCRRGNCINLHALQRTLVWVVYSATVCGLRAALEFCFTAIVVVGTTAAITLNESKFIVPQ